MHLSVVATYFFHGIRKNFGGLFIGKSRKSHFFRYEIHKIYVDTLFSVSKKRIQKIKAYPFSKKAYTKKILMR